LRHAADHQAGLGLLVRFDKTILVRSAARELAIQEGLAQKLGRDLERVGVIADPHKLESQWGLLEYALTAFGLDLIRYIREPSAYQGEEPPPMESPQPPASAARLGDVDEL
jgi:hypothetical protein